MQTLDRTSILSGFELFPLLAHQVHSLDEPELDIPDFSLRLTPALWFQLYYLEDSVDLHP